MDAKLGHSNIFLVRVCFESPRTNGPGSLGLVRLARLGRLRLSWLVHQISVCYLLYYGQLAVSRPGLDSRL